MKAEDQVNQIKSKLLFEIHNHKESNGLTQIKIASLCGITQQRVSDILKGNASVTIDMLIKVAVNIGIKNVLKKVML